jgi:uncharacterized protein (DUF2252 family)
MTAVGTDGPAARGRALRKGVPRAAHSKWVPPADRADPVALLAASDANRLADLVPLRYGRMAASPFAFLRGAAVVMAHDLATTPTTGLRVQAGGDVHAANFGLFGTPERRTVFDVNDFDETLPGPWEWDVKRLAASLQVLGVGNRWRAPDRRRVVLATLASYRTRLAELATMAALDVWYSEIDADQVQAFFAGKGAQLAKRDIRRAEQHTNLLALKKLTAVVDGQRLIVEDPPRIVRCGEAERGVALGLMAGYRRSLSEERRVLFDHYSMVDVARKVVGVGSVGMRCWVVLCEGGDPKVEDWLFLQVKEAQVSVLAPFVGPCRYAQQGRRVVVGQRLVQAATDVLLGWCRDPVAGRDFFVRQLWDRKGDVDVTALDVAGLTAYGRLCGWALALAHARSGDAAAISGYLGTGDVFDRAVAQFAAGYAEQNASDHAVLLAAIDDGRLPASAG